MRNTFGKLCVIIATLVLLFSAAFFTVALILRDNDAIEQKYKELDVSSQVGIGTPDLSRATTALLDYMRGDRVNIKVEAKVNGGDVQDLFHYEKEIVHMAEVQTLWLGLEAFAKFGAPTAGVLAFMGVWAIFDFSSFWTVFHFIIFPKSLFRYLSAGATVQAMNELNWVLPADSIMVNMLMPVFPSIVLRCAIAVIIEIVVVGIVAVFVRFAWRKEGKPSPIADIVVIERDETEPIPIKGPDLVLSHILQNAPVSKREDILRRARNGEPPVEETPSSPVREHLVDPIYPKAEEAPADPQEPEAPAQQEDSDREPSIKEEAEPSSSEEASDPDAAEETHEL